MRFFLKEFKYFKRIEVKSDLECANSRLNHKYKSCNIVLIFKGILGSSQMSLAKNFVVRQMHFVV